MIADAGLTVRDAIRQKDTPYAELGLDDPDLSDDQLVDALLAQPILINRPFVVTPLGTRLSRPSELVLEILPETHKGAFTKEDGEKVFDARGGSRLLDDRRALDDFDGLAAVEADAVAVGRRHETAGGAEAFRSPGINHDFDALTALGDDEHHGGWIGVGDGCRLDRGRGKQRDKQNGGKPCHHVRRRWRALPSNDRCCPRQRSRLREMMHIDL